MSAPRKDQQFLVSALSAWARENLPDLQPVTILGLATPAGGVSSETYMVDAAVGPQQRPAAWVLRVEASVFQVYQDPSVERQYRVMKTLAEHTDVPVPAVLAYEGDSRHLGAPFYLMERVAGRCEANRYHTQGVLYDATPAERERMWLSTIEAMAKVNCADPEPFAFLGLPEFGPDAAAQELGRWDRYLEWGESPELPVITRARRWLSDHPAPKAAPSVAWGDARLGNIVFRDGVCAAMLDWETASLGGGETDLGWWMCYDQMIAEGAGVARLEGVGGRDALIAAWETFAGRKVVGIEWHEVFGAWRFAIIAERAVRLGVAQGRRSASETGDGNPSVRYLQRLMARM